ncbi:MAG: hypothetical protein D6753_03015 [Planctomycetota bacterium]|nr:MAG: hypothetical protein D6753_03015 [Planctomycetota bacterium]
MVAVLPLGIDGPLSGRAGNGHTALADRPASTSFQRALSACPGAALRLGTSGTRAAMRLASPRRSSIRGSCRVVPRTRVGWPMPRDASNPTPRATTNRTACPSFAAA